MFGNFQQSHLRIELAGTSQEIGQKLSSVDGLGRLLAPGKMSYSGAQPLRVGDNFATTWGWLKVEQQVALASDRSLRLLLHGAIDGYQEWSWGDGWVQSCTVGVSALPLTALQTLQLIQLQQALGDGVRDCHQAQD
jgi:hypothetical protein